MNTAGAFFVLDVMTEPKIFSDPQWRGTNYAQFLNSAGIWGAIGAKRFIGHISPYYNLLLAFPIGALLPIIPWMLNKKWPHFIWPLINFPILLIGPYPGGTNSYFLPLLLVGFICQFYMLRYHRAWFDKVP